MTRWGISVTYPFLAACALFLFSCARESEDFGEDRMLAKIGPVVLTKAELEARVLEIGPQYVRYLRSDAGKKTLMKAVLERKLMARVALARGLQKDPGVQEDLKKLAREQARSLRVYRESRLVEALQKRLRDGELRVSDEDVAGYYKEHQRLTQVRHILLADSQAAHEASRRLKSLRGNLAGEFAKLSRAQSLDAESAGRGGKIPAYLAGEMEEPFESAVAKLSPGQVSDPIQTALGYHVVLLEERRLALFSEEIRERCRKILLDRKLHAMMGQWRVRYPVEVYDETLRSYLPGK
jgi:parvulin-like peptidyl-prolyl isomerase